MAKSLFFNGPLFNLGVGLLEARIGILDQEAVLHGVGGGRLKLDGL